MAERASPLERHIQTVIQVVLVALLIWSGQSIIELKDKMARVEEKLTSLQQSANDRYPKSQAALEFGALKRHIEDIEREQNKDTESLREWMQSLRDRVIELEAFARTKGFDPRGRRETIPRRE